MPAKLVSVPPSDATADFNNHAAVIARNQRNWNPWLYELWFRLNPFQAALRQREYVAVTAALERQLSSDDEVLELGSGTGHYTLPLARRCTRVTALDGSSQMMSFLRRRLGRQRVTNVEPRLGRLPEALDFARQFDGVLAVGVFNYLPDLESALRGVSARMRPGAWAVVTVPLPTYGGRIYQLGERLSGHRVWLHSAEDLSPVAAASGLELQRVTPAGLSRPGLTLVAEMTRKS